jgi:hydrogenase expression/formation protein HypD
VRQHGTVPLDGFIGPAHVSIVIGSRPYEHFAEEYRKPVVIAGFEPLDVMQAVLMLVRQVNEGRAEVENEFTRAVTRDGNLPRRRWWPRCSSCAPASNGAAWARCPTARCDPRERMPPSTPSAASACTTAGARPQAVRVRRHPARRQAADRLQAFGTVCTPENPMGSCMVSSEGACAAHYTYGRFKDIAVVTATA